MATKDDDVVQGVGDFFVGTSQYNQLCFVIRRIISEMVNTSALVSVNGVDSAGHDNAAGSLSATPLVAQTDAKGNALPMVPIPRLRFFRYQAGKAAVVLDPVPGDQGVAVFHKSDSSGVKSGATKPVVPGSFRTYDQSDGVVFPSVQGAAPSVWIELKQDETIVIHAPKGVTIETDEEVSINAGEKITLTAPQIELNGDMQANGTLMLEDVNMNTHTHGGVDTGDGNTDGPQ